MHAGSDDEIEPAKQLEQLLGRVEVAVDVHRAARVGRQQLCDLGRDRAVVGAAVLGRPLARGEERHLGAAVC